MRFSKINKRFLFPVFLLIFIPAILYSFGLRNGAQDDDIISFTVDPKNQSLDFYWKNENGEILKSIENLKKYIESKQLKLLFAMNGGMFNKDNSPQGLYIERGKTYNSLNMLSGKGNFYLKPNGVFYLTSDNKPNICKSSEFKDNGRIKYATQSGPMLLVNGKIHPAFKKGSENLFVRNGVGILPDNKVIFAISKKEINFYDFANYFKHQGCKNALYLDGFVSRAYMPEKKWVQLDGNFGVMIGITESQK